MHHVKKPLIKPVTYQIILNLAIILLLLVTELKKCTNVWMLNYQLENVDMSKAQVIGSIYWHFPQFYLNTVLLKYWKYELHGR